MDEDNSRDKNKEHSRDKNKDNIRDKDKDNSRDKAKFNSGDKEVSQRRVSQTRQSHLLSRCKLLAPILNVDAKDNIWEVRVRWCGKDSGRVVEG